MKRYNIYIVNKKTRKAESIIGRDMSSDRATKRVIAGLMNINSDYYIDDVVAGSDQDNKLKQDLI